MQQGSDPAAVKLKRETWQAGNRDVLRIVLIYAVLASLWILFSDEAVQAMFSDPAQIIRASMVKGWVFVAVTSLILFALVQRLFERMRKASLREHASQQEKLHALELLATIADSSDDAIFAKDPEGRYILFNRAASRYVGKPAEEVLGRDDREIFPPQQAEMLMAIDRRVLSEGRVETNEERLDTSIGQRTFLATKGPLRNAAGKVTGSYGISRDITERKEAEVMLKQQRDLNQRYLDTVQTILVALDDNGCVSMINQAGQALLGYKEEELLGRNWFETCLPQPEGMEKVHPVFLQAMAGKLESFEYHVNPVLCRDGRQRLVAWHNIYLPDESGNIIGTLSSGEDITSQRLADDALKQLADDMKATLHAIPDLLFELDGNGRYLKAEATANDLLAAPVDQLLGHTVSEILPPEAARTVMDSLAQAALAGSDYGRTIILPLAGGIRHFELSVSRKGMSSGSVPHFIVLSRDITDRKTAEDELRHRNEELERFNRVTVGRELDMIELKKRINELSRELGRKEPYTLAFLGARTDQPQEDNAP